MSSSASGSSADRKSWRRARSGGPGPGRSQRCPRPAEHITGPVTEDSGGLRPGFAGLDEVNYPAADVGTLQEHLEP